MFTVKVVQMGMIRLLLSFDWKLLKAKADAENPKNWRDGAYHKVSYIAAVYNNAPDYTCYKI